MSKNSAVAFMMVVFGVLAGVVARAAPPESDAPLVLAVHPYLPANELETRFRPLAEYLARAINHPIQVRVGRNYADHIEAVGKDVVDIAYMGPAPYVTMVANFGKKPVLARQEIGRQPDLYGVIIVRKESPISSLAELKGKRFAYGDPESTMSHAVPKKMLENAGVPESALGGFEYLGSHKNVALAVLGGDFDAGAVKLEVFNEMEPRGLRSIATSPGVPDHLFVARSTMPESLIKSLRSALLKLSNVPSGVDVMRSIHPNMTAFIAANDADYDVLRSLMGVSITRK